MGFREWAWSGVLRLVGSEKRMTVYENPQGEISLFGVGLWCGYSETVPVFLTAAERSGGVAGGLGDFAERTWGFGWEIGGRLLAWAVSEDSMGVGRGDF